MDILPSFIVAIFMFILVYAIGFIPINPFILLPLQIILGAAFTITVCETIKLPEYIEIKCISLPIINKVLKHK